MPSIANILKDKENYIFRHHFLRTKKLLKELMIYSGFRSMKTEISFKSSIVKIIFLFIYRNIDYMIVLTYQYDYLFPNKITHMSPFKSNIAGKREDSVSK